MQTLRTPDERFAGSARLRLRTALHDARRPGRRGARGWPGSRTARPTVEPVLLLHGEPSWSFLYRTMMPVLAAAGLRAIAPDLVGFGRSDKPTRTDDHTYARHVEWIRALVVDVLDLQAVTLVGQDWGGLIGLRLAAEHPDRFARIVAANTGLPTGDHPMPDIWHQFKAAVESAERLDIARFVQSGCRRAAGARGARRLRRARSPRRASRPARGRCPGWCRSGPTTRPATRTARPGRCCAPRARPMLLAFSDNDPITGGDGADPRAARMPGARGRTHPTIADAGHFLQEDAGPGARRRGRRVRAGHAAVVTGAVDSLCACC